MTLAYALRIRDYFVYSSRILDPVLSCPKEQIILRNLQIHYKQNFIFLHHIAMNLAIFLYLFVLLPLALAKIGFVKDSGMDTPFPPPMLEPPHKVVPRGHLRPLGFQCPPERRVTEYKGLPTSYSFFHGYVKQEQPILFHEAVPTDQTEKLTDDYLRDTYGDTKVRVTIKRAMYGIQEYKMIKIQKFLREYMYENWYLSTIIPQEMRKDMPFPKVLQCGTFSRYLHESQLWMSSGGTLSLLHYHGDHQLHCLLDGRKDFVFINKKHAKAFGLDTPDDFTGSSHSAMDTEMVNMFKYEKAGNVKWEWASLRPGDCIFVPAGLLHHVRSYGRSISSVTLWTPTHGADFADCDKDKDKEKTKTKGKDKKDKESKPKEKTKTLDDANLIWTFVNGKRQLSNVKLSAESLRHHLFAILRTDEKLSFRYFETFYLTALKGVKNLPHSASDAWALLDPKKTGHIKRGELKKLSAEALDKVAAMLNLAHQQKPKKPITKSKTKVVRDEL